MNFGSLSATACGSRYSSKNAKSNSVRQQRQLARTHRKANEGDAVLALSLRCQKCQRPSHPHHPSSQPPTKWLAQRPNPTPHTQQRLSRSHQRQHSLTLRSSQRLCQQIRSTASKPLVSSRNMDRKNLTTRRTTDIAKILSHTPSSALRCVVRNDIARTLRTLWADTLGLRPTAFTLKRWWVAQAVDFESEVESSKRLKIRVSMVRFRPRPPFETLVAAMLLGFSTFCERRLKRQPRFTHLAATLGDFAW